MLEDFPPGGILRRAAPVALVNDDEIKEILGEFLRGRLKNTGFLNFNLY